MEERIRLLKVVDLSKRYGKSVFSHICFDVYAGECLAIIGESGSGKTTLGRCLIRLTEPDRGAVIYKNKNILQLPQKEFRRLRPLFQMIFQNPVQALNPKLKVGDCISEPLRFHYNLEGGHLESKVDQLLQSVGLTQEIADRYPAQLSGGQRQRVTIARALTTNPTLLIADEPTSNLDAHLKRQFVDLLKSLQAQRQLTLVLISHDLGLVSGIADRIAVMQKGVFVEIGTAENVLQQPAHPYTQLLLRSSLLKSSPLTGCCR